MNKKLNVLIIDDHPLIIDCHINALENIEEEYPEISFKIKTAFDCDQANHEIETAADNVPFDLVILDIRLPPAKNSHILSGEDLGMKIRELFPKIKILIFTSCNDNYRLNSILKNMDPDGFLIKSDVGFSDLMDAVIAVIQDPPYYSKSISKLMRKKVSSDVILDAIDRQLLYHLSIGSRTKNLPNVIPLSLASIERRKKKLKELFDAEVKEDKVLIEKARIKGFI